MEQAELVGICREIFGTEPDFIEHPGGKNRRSVVVGVRSGRYVISKRKTEGRAALEAQVLQRLGKTGRVPKLIHHKSRFVVQEHLEGQRLSEALAQGGATAQENLLQAAVESLFELQVSASDAGLHRFAPDIGARENWGRDFVDMPRRVAEKLGLEYPDINHNDMLANISGPDVRFIKWDARPGNAMVDRNGAVSWFDWEHSGCRSACDDIVWLLADEWCPSNIPAEQAAIGHLARQTGQSRDIAEIGFKTRAVLHSFVRLSLIFESKGNGAWSNKKAALAQDRIGVTAGQVDLVCQRAARWAGDVDFLRPLADLLMKTNGYAQQL